MSKSNKKEEKKVSAVKSVQKFDYAQFKNKFLWIPATLLVIFFVLFCTSVFKNITYPLFWADESMTAMGSERVLNFGFPKVHDGKNVFYDLRHTNPTLGINEDDAYIGGTGWGHYYFGTIGYTLAAGEEDVFSKTAIFRSTFAMLGILGLAIFAFFVSHFFEHIFDRLSFASLFTLLCLLSVPLALHIREVRYYSLVIFLVSTILGLYSLHRFKGKVNPIAFSIVISLLLPLLFISFAPVFFIVLVAIALTEGIILVSYLLNKKPLTEYFSTNWKSLVGYLVAIFIVLPLLSYFKTFEISKAMAEFNGYNSKMYWQNAKTIYDYFRKFELLYLAIILKAIVWVGAKKNWNTAQSLYQFSGFLAVFFVVSLFLMARIPNFIYTRYIIFLQPVVAISVVLDLFTLLYIRSQKSTTIVNSIMILFIALVAGGILHNISTNSKTISGHLAEISEPYKGPLDYTIPAIKEKYVKTDTLVVATNYEETSYMYYLGCKAAVGFIGNNLEEDAKVLPHVISYRKPWGNHIDIFQNYMKQSSYIRLAYPVYDNPVNNIPELNFMPAFNHKFKTLTTENEQEKTDLYFRQ